MRRHRLMAAALIVLLGWTLRAGAQNTGGLPPAIVTFSGDPMTVRLDEVEVGTAQVTLAWRTVNVDARTHVVDIEAMQLGQWVRVPDPNRVLDAVGELRVPVTLPYSFSPPVYRLSIRTQQGDLLDQRFLPLSYETPDDLAPRIETFEVEAASVDVNDLASGQARIPVNWSVIDRPPASNLIFVQVLTDGSERSAELPRPFLWVQSRGRGVVSPTSAASSAVDLRLRLVDAISGEVYDEASAALSITGTLRPTQVGTVPTAPPPPSNPGDSTGPVQIVSFTASPNPADPAGTLALNWNVRSAPSVMIVWSTRGPDPTTGYNSAEHRNLPPTGSLVVNLPDVWFFNSAIASFALTVTDANGQYIYDPAGIIYSATVEVALKHNMTINSFTANPASARRSENVQLSWDVANAARVNITGGFESANNPPRGSVTVTLPNAPYDYQSYWLDAVDSNNVTIRRELKVPIICTFTSQFTGVCPYTQESVGLAFQPFERGQMLWRGDTRTIYVLYGDSTYENFADTWTDGEPINITDTPPAPLIAPARGFGKLWATEPRIRQALGWATAIETSYSSTVETVLEGFWKFPIFGTYLRLSNGTVAHFVGASNRLEILR